MACSCSETAQGGDFGKGPDPIGGEDIWREMSEHRLEAAGSLVLVEILKAVEGTEEKREYKRQEYLFCILEGGRATQKRASLEQAKLCPALRLITSSPFSA